MPETDVVAVVGTCEPERAHHAERLAALADRALITANRLRRSPDPLGEALALAPWADRPNGAVIDFPADTRATELIGALAAETGRIRLSGVVCVADALHLTDDLRRDSYAARTRIGERGGAEGAATEYIAHAMLTVTQLEYASTIVLVNWEPLATPNLAALMALVSHLSPRARLRLEHGAAEVPLPGARYAPEQERAGWVTILNGEHDPHMTDPRVRTLRYENVRPLHPERLMRLLNDRVEPGEFGTVIRSAGFCRLATRSHVVAEWDHVGRMLSLEPSSGDGGLGADELPALGQDLAFIGLDLDGAALAAGLDGTALTDEEFAAGPAAWAGYADPFPAWDPAWDQTA